MPLGPAGFKSDLDANSVNNPYSVAPSSRDHTQTFTKADIERLHPASVFDLLTHATGVQPSYRGRKHVFNLNIRGDSNFGFVIDGVYLPDFIGGRILAALPVSVIEQLEVVRDGTALTLGPSVNLNSASGANNSGFIVIHTRRPDKTEAEVRAALETYGTETASAYAGTTFAKDGWTGYVAGMGSYRTTDGPDGYNMWADSKNGFAKLGIGRGGFFTEAMLYRDNAAFGFERARAGEVTNGPNPMQNIPNQNWSYDPIDTLFFASNSRMSWDKHNTTLFTASITDIEQSNVLATYDNTSFDVNEESDRLESISLRHRIAFADTLLEGGGQYVHWHSPSGELYFPGREREEEIWGGFVRGEQKLFHDMLTLDASGRIDKRTIDKGIDLYDESTLMAGLCSGQMTNPAGEPCLDFYDRDLPLAKSISLGAAVAVTREISVSGRYGHTSQDAPDGLPSATGRPLDGETLDKWEAAVSAHYVPWFVPTLTYFDTRVDNDTMPLNYFVPLGGSNYVAHWKQVDSRRAGIELCATGTLTGPGLPGKLTYSAGWTHLTEYEATSSPQDTYNDAAYPDTRPHDLINATITEEVGPYFATVSLSHVSSYLNNFRAPQNGSPATLVYNSVGDYQLLDASFGRHFTLGEWDFDDDALRPQPARRGLRDLQRLSIHRRGRGDGGVVQVLTWGSRPRPKTRSVPKRVRARGADPLLLGLARSTALYAILSAICHGFVLPAPDHAPRLSQQARWD